MFQMFHMFHHFSDPVIYSETQSISSLRDRLIPKNTGGLSQKGTFGTREHPAWH